MTEKERRGHRCPTCHAIPGAACVDPKGDPTPRCHRTRGPGEHERHVQAGIDRKAARDRASYGPLFQELAEAEVRVPTVAEKLLADRMAHARSFDATHGPHGAALLDKANGGLEWIAVHAMARTLEQMAGETGRLMAEHTIGVYPQSYQRMMFARLFTTTERKEVGPHRVPADNRPGFTIAYHHTWEPAAPLMTREEFDRRFPMPDHFRGVGEQPDDPQDLFGRVMAHLEART